MNYDTLPKKIYPLSNFYKIWHGGESPRPAPSCQISPLSCAMFRFVEYIAESHCTILNNAYSFLFAFYTNYGRIFSRYDTIHKRDGQTDTARRLSIAWQKSRK